MRSFDVAIEPAASRRLAAGAALFHGAAAAMPWIVRASVPVAAALTLLAVAGLVLTVARLPGRHARLAALRIDGHGCRVRLRDRRGWQHAAVSPRSRAYAGLIALELRAGGRSSGWLLARDSLAPEPFRRLKARIRLDARLPGLSHARRGFRPPNHDLAN